LGNDLVLTFFEHSSQHAIERFVAACDQAEMKISTTMAEKMTLQKHKMQYAESMRQYTEAGREI